MSTTVENPATVAGIAAVFKDCVDQLAVLSGTTPVSSQMMSTAVGDAIKEIVEQQRELEVEYDNVLSEREELISTDAPPRAIAAVERKLKNISNDLHDSTQALLKNLRQNPGSAENMIKIETERRFLQSIMSEALTEVCTERTFKTISSSTKEQVEKISEAASVADKEQKTRERIAKTKALLAEAKASHVRESQEKQELIATLKDELQEIKARTILEAKYIKAEAEVRIAMTAKKCGMESSSLSSREKELQSQIEEEKKANAEVEKFLKENYSKRAELLDTWMNKFETDNEDKQKELESLKAARAKDLAKLQELTEKYQEFQQVCNTDRKRKEKQKLAAEQAVRELAASVRLQAWWRGMLVRHKLGPFKAKSKGKKGKKGKGKKKKK